MKTKVKHIDKCSRLFEVEISPEIVSRTLEEVYKEIKKRAKIPGFRVGMVPQSLLEKYHAKDAEEEVLRRLIPEGYKKALYEHKINPVTLPEVSDVEFGKSRKISFKAKVEIRPGIKLKNYKGIKVKKNKIDTSKDEISQVLKKLQEINAQFLPAEDRRPLRKGDHAICDIEALVEGRPISKKHENMSLTAEKEASMLGLGENLIGLGVGESKEVETKLPQNYPDKKFAGKKALFRINIKEIKTKKLPEIDDEFAKDLGKENLKSLEEDIARQLFEKKDASRIIDMENQILDKLLKDYKFDVPQSMIKRQCELLMKQAEQKLLSGGMHKDDLEKEKKELEPKLKNDAINKIKIYFILNEISKVENIQPTEDDASKRLEGIGRLSNQDINTLRDYYEKNNLIDGLMENIKEEKTLDWLLSAASIAEEK